MKDLSPALSLFFYLLVEFCDSLYFNIISGVGVDVMDGSFGMSVLRNYVYRAISAKKIFESELLT